MHLCAVAISSRSRLCRRHALRVLSPLRRCFALFCHALPFQRSSPPCLCFAFAQPCASLRSLCFAAQCCCPLCRRTSLLRFALPSRRQSVIRFASPSHCAARLRLAIAPRLVAEHCRRVSTQSLHFRRFALLCRCGATLRFALPLLCAAHLRRCPAAIRLAFPLPLRFAPCNAFAFRSFAVLRPCTAEPCRYRVLRASLIRSSSSSGVSLQ